MMSAERDFRAQPVIRDGDGDAVQLQAAGDMAELRLVQRPPIAAMDEHHDPPAGIVLGVEDVAGVKRVRAIGKRELAAHAVAECRSVAAPAIDDRLVPGDAGAVVVLPVEIHAAGDDARWGRLCQVPPDHPSPAPRPRLGG